MPDRLDNGSPTKFKGKTNSHLRLLEMFSCCVLIGSLPRKRVNTSRMRELGEYEQNLGLCRLIEECSARTIERITRENIEVDDQQLIDNPMK
jgi:hypothetical protein